MNILPHIPNELSFLEFFDSKARTNFMAVNPANYQLVGKVAKKEIEVLTRTFDKLVSGLDKNEFATQFEALNEELNKEDFVDIRKTFNERRVFLEKKFCKIFWEKISSSPVLKNNEGLLLFFSAYKNNWHEFASEELRNNRDFIEKAVQGDGMALKSASPLLKDDKEIVMLAVSQNGKSIEGASPRLRDDEDIVKKAISKNGYAIAFASDRLKDSEDFAKTAVSRAGDALRYVSIRLRDDLEICSAAILNNPQAIEFASARLQNDKFLVTLVVSKAGYLLEFMPEEFKDDIDVVKAAIVQDVTAVEAASSRLQNHEEIKELLDDLSKKPITEG